MNGFESTRDIASQGIVAALLVVVFALLAADRVHRVLIPIGAVAVIWLISYFSPFKLISFQAAQAAVDLNVILLLFSMMALVGVLKTTNVFPSSFESSDWTYTYQGMGGADISLSPHVALRADARYLWAKAQLSRSFTGFDRIDLSGAQATLGLTYRI